MIVKRDQKAVFCVHTIILNSNYYHFKIGCTKFIKSEDIKIEEKFDLFGLKTGTNEKEVIGKAHKIG